MTMHICLLEHRGVIRIGGPDRRSFLQGLISNDINLCLPGKPLYAALLTPQGKFLHDMFILDDGDNFLVDCEAARIDDLLRRLTAHKLRAKVTLDKDTGYGVWAGWSDERPAQSEWFADPRLPALGFRAIVKQGTKLEGQMADFAAYDRHRIRLGVPDGSRDMIPEKSTLLECNMDRLNAVSWSKGCYMGQELTARMHYRGLVKKRLFPVTIDGAAPAPGSVIRLHDEDVGEMRSSCGDVGLALLNIEKALSASFRCDGAILSAC